MKSGKSLKKKGPNPFDLKVTKPKFDILNKDKRGVKGAPGKSNLRNTEIRKATLLPELSRRSKTSSFLDKRFGERDKNLSVEEKMLERFSKERKKSSNLPGLKKKKSIFNLDANEEYGDDSLASLTHMGKEVDEIEEFSDPEEGTVSFDKGFIDSKDHFGGFHADEGVPKTKAEIMREVMAKSKFYKAERQKIKEENEDLCIELDEDFDTIKSSLHKYDRSAEIRVEDDYDAVMKRMMFDKRSKVTDRMLSEEEAKKKREQAEEAREARMQGRREEDDSDEDDDDHQDLDKSSKQKEVKRDTEKDEERAHTLLNEFCEAASLDQTNVPYKKIVEMSTGPSSVALGRAIRSQLSRILLRFRDRRPFFPSKPILMLFHLIGTIYSTSDFHHVIATPAHLIMTAFLETGRMTRPKHVISALFLCQTILHYQRDSKRVVPEVFNLLNLIIRYTTNEKSNTCAYDGIYNKIIEDRLKQSLSNYYDVEPVKLTFDDLIFGDCKEFTSDLSKKILASSLWLIKRVGELYSECPSLPEYLKPLLIHQQKHHFTMLRASRKPLVLQHHKPIALPMLNPDLGTSDDKEVRETSRLKAAYRREFKGAKRELRRDNEFLARHEASERKRKDQDYRQMINRVYGTISNDNGSSKKPRRK